jgi:hypothetical protein
LIAILPKFGFRSFCPPLGKQIDNTRLLQFFKPSRDEKVRTIQAGLPAWRQGERRRWAFFNSLFIADKPYKKMLDVGYRSVSQERRRLRNRLSDDLNAQNLFKRLLGKCND